MRKINPETWNRRDIFSFYSRLSDPIYSVSFTADVTGVYRYSRSRHLSFYCSMIHVCTAALNSIENFRYVVRDGDVYLLDARRPSFTDLRPGEELFHITTVDAMDDLDAFVATAKARSLAQTCFLEESDEGDDLIFFSCLPQLRMTGFTGAGDRGSRSRNDSNIPSVLWGRWEETDGRIQLCLFVEVNHRFVDGLHVSRFAEQVEALSRALEQRL